MRGIDVPHHVHPYFFKQELQKLITHVSRLYGANYSLIFQILQYFPFAGHFCHLFLLNLCFPDNNLEVGVCVQLYKVPVLQKAPS